MGKDDGILTERRVGMIMPPPDVKKIIDKAAELVGKYGSNIEGLMKNEDKNLPKFTFLKPNDPYRPYYDYKVAQVAKNLSGNKTVSNNNGENANNVNNQHVSKDAKIFLGRKTESTSDAQSLLLQGKGKRNVQDDIRKFIEEKKMDKDAEIRPPPADQFSISHPNIAPLDMDLIKLTAQFVARNGQKFLTGLSEREAKNTQFDFLKPQHNLFGYFTHLVESYSKSLLPKKDDLTKLQNMQQNDQFILRRTTDRYLWERKSKENIKKKDTVTEEERAQMAQIDWNEFVVVDVIEFTEEELNNTVPITSSNQNQNANSNFSSYAGNINLLLSGAAALASQQQQNEIAFASRKELQQQQGDVLIVDENEVISNSKRLLGLAAFEKENRDVAGFNNVNSVNLIVNSEESKLNPEAKKDKDKEKEKEKEIVNAAQLPEPGMKIVTNYKRKAESGAAKKGADAQRCPFCHENIPIDELSQHMKIELLDPKWKEINKEIQERKMEVNIAPTSDFISYLGDFAKDRPDLFGEDVGDILKLDEIKKLETKINMQNIRFDGFAPNMSRTTANIAMLAQQTKKNYEESTKIKEVQTAPVAAVPAEKGNVPIAVKLQEPVLSAPSVQKAAVPLKKDIQPISQMGKRMVENLVAEDFWIAKNPNAIKINVRFPETAPQESWNFIGQMKQIQGKPKEKLYEIKARALKELQSEILNQNLDAPFDILRVKDFYGNILNENQSLAFYNFENNVMLELELI